MRIAGIIPRLHLKTWFAKVNHLKMVNIIDEKERIPSVLEHKEVAFHLDHVYILKLKDLS